MLNQLVRSAGIQVTDVWLGRFQLPDEVTQQFVTFWQSEWQRRATELRADGEATLIRELGNAQSKAQQVLIETLVAAFQSARDSGLDIDPRQLAALRLIDSLEAAYQQAGKPGEGAGLQRPPFNRLRQELHFKQTPSTGTGDTAGDAVATE
jgi:regulator of protease activity HflC (stomatin/prohibitin superfamily)